MPSFSTPLSLAPVRHGSLGVSTIALRAGSKTGTATGALADATQRQQAAQLIQRGLRLGALRSLFRELSTETLSRLYREVCGAPAQPGRLPTSFVGQLKTPADALAGAVLLRDYIALSGDRGRFGRIEPSILAAVWDRFCSLLGVQHFSDRCVTLDITSLWLLARDYRAGSVQLSACAGCGNRYLRFVAAAHRLCAGCSGR